MTRACLTTMTAFLLILPLAVDVSAAENVPLQPWSENAWYWEYHGQPVLLYDVNCKGAQGYLSLAREVLQLTGVTTAQEQP